MQDGTNIADYMASRTPARDRVLVFSHEKSAVRAAQIGWDTASLLGCHPTRPLDPLNGAGLLWRISGGKITGHAERLGDDRDRRRAAHLP